MDSYAESGLQKVVVDAWLITFYPVIKFTCKYIEKICSSSILLGFLNSDWMVVIPTSGIAKCGTQSKQQAAFAWCQLSFLQTKVKQQSVSNGKNISKGGT